MARTDVATRHVVERCPRCGVEHDTSADAVCEACDTPFRAWCRVHGRETGWLEGPSCARWADEAAPAVEVEDAGEPANPPGFAEQVVAMVVMMLMSIAGGAMAGVVPGLLFVLLGGWDLRDTTRDFASGGAILGGLFGLLCWRSYMEQIRTPPAAS